MTPLKTQPLRIYRKTVPARHLSWQNRIFSLRRKQENKDLLGPPQRASSEAGDAARGEPCFAGGPSRCLNRAQAAGLHSLDFGRDFEAPHTRGGELPGVDVGDLLQGAVDVPDVVTFHHQDGLRGVEVILENRRE